MLTGSMPNITMAQLLAALQWTVAQIVAMGWCSQESSKVIISAGSTLIAFAWILGDAYLRGKRISALAVNPTAVQSINK